MKRRLLDLLCCPVCHGALTLKSFAEDGEVEEGCVTCTGCDRTFPVINGIPRLLPDALAHLVVKYHLAFFHRYATPMVSYLTRCRDERQGRWWRSEQRTLTSYSYQWRRFKRMLPQWEQVFRDSIRPIEPSFFHGKVGLDAGCGFGRSLVYAAAYGAEVIGADLSEAVESARENTGHLPNVHVIQADIYHLPLRERSLDFIYSIVVLDHLPDPQRGFLKLTSLLGPGSPVIIWVYSRGKGRQIACLTLMRAIARQLPLPLLSMVCWLGAALQWILWIVPYCVLHRFSITRPLAQRLPFTFHARYPFYVLHTDWFDGLSVPLVNYYRRDEIADWYREAGLERVVLGSDWGYGGGGRAIGFAPPPSGTKLVPT